jgi:hypothetical protein
LEKEEIPYRECLTPHPKHSSIDIAGNIMAYHNFNKGDMYGNNSLYLGSIKNLKLTKKPKIPTVDNISK